METKNWQHVILSNLKITYTVIWHYNEITTELNTVLFEYITIF